MLPAAWKKNDKKASVLILVFSVIVFTAVVALSRVKLNADLGFDIHIFARINAIINSIVSVLLVAALLAVKSKRYTQHKKTDADSYVSVGIVSGQLYLPPPAGRRYDLW